uniref:Interleukin-1 receptor-associated kinase 1-binding protein 1-like n=1 Tax=Phallusia mammillata TaxID=59560 RepID=A0A6F9DEM2_9ASCI|nr:interleukin-1 receptor-associated kinase 1-binding protein 1-like [Phallusia mammillata]
MCSKRRGFDASHVFANLSPRIITANDDNVHEKQKRKVEVSGSAEFTVPPDRCILTIVIKNKKEQAADAKASVERRLEYIVQTLLNNGLHSCDVEVTKNLSRPTGRNLYHMEAQVDAVFTNDLQKCLSVSNLFIEKLDNCVTVLPPILKHDKQRLESTRKQACLTALANARQKALEVCRLLGQTMGRPINVTENIVREWRGSGATPSDEPPECAEPPLPTVEEVMTSGPIDVQRRVTEQSITVRVDVTAVFEIRAKLEKNK